MQEEAGWRAAVGEVVRLEEALGEVADGLWVITDLGFMATVNRLGEDEDGDLCTLHRQVKVTLVELEQFRPLFLNLFTPVEMDEAGDEEYGENEG